MSKTVKTGQRFPSAGQVYNPNTEDFGTANIDKGYTGKDASGFISSRYQRTYPLKTYVPDGAPQNTGEGVKSLANRYSLFQYKGLVGANFLDKDYLDSNESLIHSDTWYKIAENPTTANIIEAFDILGRQGLSYSWSDFLYAKYHRKIPNNYMVTVRRFAFPQMDNLFDPAMYDHKTEKVVDTTQPELARAVTWMGESTGNSLEEFFSFSFGFNWKDLESEVQVLASNSQGIQGSSILGIGTTGFGIGAAVSSVATTGSGQTTANGRQIAANAGFDATKETYPNHTEGPINVIKKMIIQDPGLEFNHEFELKFQYNLAAHGSINPKMAFLDILSNLLVLTYNNAPFWGGSARYTGNGTFGSPLGDHDLLASGDLGGFLKSLISDAGGLLSNTFGNGNGGFSVESVLGGLGDVAGDMLGGFLSENLNSPQGAQVAAAFLSGDPTGKWHVAIGNPMNPIAMIGNLVLDDTTMKLSGPLGRDDFPTELEVTMKFKHGRPRDKSEIEQMFNAGRGRMYFAPEGDDVDILNLEGREPKNTNGTVKEYAGFGADTVSAIRKNNKKGGDVYADDLEEIYNTSIDAADKAWVKLMNVAKFVTEG
jgi:hypothetical protein